MSKKDAIKKRNRLFAAALCAAAAIIGEITFAWYTSQNSLTNTFLSGSLKTVIVENFTPPAHWTPGVTTDKVVQAVNTGTLDAYVRLELVPVLNYYAPVKASYTDTASGTTTDYAVYAQVDSNGDIGTQYVYYVDGVSNDYTAAGESYSFVPANVSYIEDLVSKDTERTWVELTSSTYLTVLSGNAALSPLSSYLTVPENVTLYAAASISQDSTYSYEFMGYYTDTDKNKTYSVTVASPEYTDGGNTLTSLSVMLQLTQLYTYSYADADGQTVIDSMTTLNFYNNDDPDNILTAADTDYWTERKVTDGTNTTTYYYYKKIVQSGEATVPLLSSVTFNGDYTTEIYDADFELNVVDVSSQAIYEAAEYTFQNEESGFSAYDADITLLDSDFDAAAAGLEKSSN